MERAESRGKPYDGFIFIYLGHGVEKSIICSDGEKIHIREIQDDFLKDEYIKNYFKETYKLFLFNACRGGVRGNVAHQKNVITVRTTLAGRNSKDAMGGARGNGSPFQEVFLSKLLQLQAKNNKPLDQILKETGESAWELTDEEDFATVEQVGGITVFLEPNREQ